MKKLLVVLLSAIMVCSMAACGGSGSSSSASASTDESSAAGEAKEGAYKAALLLNGTLGDKSFYDSANEGLTKLRDELGADKFDFKVEQMGGTDSDQPNWEPTLLSYCETGEYDVIIMGTWQMVDPLLSATAQYPDQKFMFFDETWDFEAHPTDKIYNIMYKQNEVSYLVGAAAAMMTTDSTIENIDPSNAVLGFIGGMDNQIINDFLVGYIQGAQDVNPDIKVAIGIVGDFVDSAKCKDIATSQFQGGVDVSFNAAGNAGLGLIEAAYDSNKYTFGVDSDQAALLADKGWDAVIPTSALKNVGNSLYAAVKEDMAGTLVYGQSVSYGFAEGGVGLVEDAHYEAMLPESIRTKLDELQQKISDGEIVVKTSKGMPTEELDAIKAEVAP